MFQLGSYFSPLSNTISNTQKPIANKNPLRASLHTTYGRMHTTTLPNRVATIKILTAKLTQHKFIPQKSNSSIFRAHSCSRYLFSFIVKCVPVFKVHKKIYADKDFCHELRNYSVCE